jgi:glycerol-3-phosphate acyltransferase PlsY
MLLDMAKAPAALLVSGSTGSGRRRPVSPPSSAMSFRCGFASAEARASRRRAGLLCVDPLAVAALAVFLSAVWITRYISVGSILASVALPPIAYATGSPAPVQAVALAASMIIIVRHRTNLARVLAGTEQRIGLRLMSREP